MVILVNLLTICWDKKIFYIVFCMKLTASFNLLIPTSFGRRTFWRSTGTSNPLMPSPWWSPGLTSHISSLPLSLSESDHQGGLLQPSPGLDESSKILSSSWRSQWIYSSAYLVKWLHWWMRSSTTDATICNNEKEVTFQSRVRRHLKLL